MRNRGSLDSRAAGVIRECIQAAAAMVSDKQLEILTGGNWRTQAQEVEKSE